jgi:hypothetical protein
MGEWGTGMFQNDYAQDLAADVRDAPDANAYLEKFLASFIQETCDGYDSSSHQEDWPPAMTAAAACEIVRLGAPNAAVASQKLPKWLPDWLNASGFVSSQQARELAKKACDILRASAWLRDNKLELFQSIIERVHARVNEMV